MNRTLAGTRVTALVAGLLFGFGLLVSGMTQPSKVLGFLDVAGDWDPSLAFVMGGAIAVHALFARRALRPGAHPVFAEAFDWPRRRDIDARLLAGAALFGIGWGIGGYCPAPAITSLASASRGTGVFVVAMAAGILGVRLTRRDARPSQPATAARTTATSGDPSATAPVSTSGG
jgi:uncharacterized membrane protein YedE/YeeE